jgi:hypothetical protein
VPEADDVDGLTVARAAGSDAAEFYREGRSAVRILRPQPVTPARRAGAPRLRCRARLADGRVFAGELPAERHRALQLGILHADTRELVELTPGVRSPDGKLDVDRRRRPEHYLPGGAGGNPHWLDGLLEHAERIVTGTYARELFDGAPREEAFVGVAPRTRRSGGKDAVAASRFLWVDVDRPGQLPALWAFLAERPCHLLIESGGSGGVHAYWKLAEPLPAARGAEEPIERANSRIIHALGTDGEGRPTVADPQCRERARVMRLAGTVNYKTGQYARVVDADLQLPGYRLEELVGNLPDPEPPPARPRSTSGSSTDTYKRIPPPEYFQRLAGIRVPRGGLVQCPAPLHDDTHPSCSVGAEPETGWCCHAASCGARGTIYDLASVLLGGPWGRELRGDAFKRARARVSDVFGARP